MGRLNVFNFWFILMVYAGSLENRGHMRIPDAPNTLLEGV